MSHKRTWKYIQAMDILKNADDGVDVYEVLDKLGYVWHAGKQKWLKTVDENSHEEKRGKEYEEMVFDMSSAQYVGNIVMPCQHCNWNLLYQGFKGEAIFGDNRIETVIANFATCEMCGKDSFSHVSWETALSSGMVSSDIDIKPNGKKRKGMGRTH